MKRCHARPFAVLAATVLVLSACGGGEQSAADDTEEAPVTLEDLKPAEDHFSREITTPPDLPDDYDEIARSAAYGVEQMLKASFTDPDVWTLTSDDAAVDAVVSSYGGLGEENQKAAAADLLKTTRENAVDGQRVATIWASTFPEDALPEEAYIFKSKWDTEIDHDERSATVRGIVWAGYEVDGKPIVIARQIAATTIANPDGTRGTRLFRPSWAGFYGQCAAVADGVLAPPDGGIPQEAAAALRKEFADTEYRSIGDAFPPMIEAMGEDPERDLEEDTEECLA